MKMNKFFNGKEINEENLIQMIQECIDDNWKNSDIEDDIEKYLEKIATQNYDGRDEDISYIIEELQAQDQVGYLHKDANLQALENIISKGKWYFQYE
jgi:hypothetical protein